MSLKCTTLEFFGFPRKKTLISLNIKKDFFDKILLRHDNNEL